MLCLHRRVVAVAITTFYVVRPRVLQIRHSLRDISSVDLKFKPVQSAL